MSIIVQKAISILVAALIYIAINLHFVAFVDVKNSTFDVRRLVTENVERQNYLFVLQKRTPHRINWYVQENNELFWTVTYR